MRIAIVGCFLVLMGGGTASAQGTQESPNQPQPPLMFEVAARGYLVGGRTASIAGDAAVDRVDSYVWADQTLCALGAGNQAPQNVPWAGWHFTGTATPNLPGEMIIDLRWERVWENGARVQGGASGARVYRVRSGERVEIDRITPPTVGPCGTVELKLEAAVTARAAYLMSPTGGVRGGVGAGARGSRGVAGRGGMGAGALSGSGAGASAGVASAGAGGRGVGTGAGSGATSGATTGVAGGRGRGTGSDASAATFALRRGAMPPRMAGAGAYDAEIWLVHKNPDGSEHVQQMSVRFIGTTREFAFPAVQVPSSGGPITLDITGSLQVLNGPGQYFLGHSAEGNRLMTARGASAARGSTEPAVTPAEPAPTPLFVVSIARHARRATPFIDTRGTTDLSIQIPKPEDVFSFELPPLQKATEDLLKGHTFSIRLRMTPVK